MSVAYPYIITVPVNSLGAKSQISSSVAPPRKKKLVTIFRQGQVFCGQFSVNGL